MEQVALNNVQLDYLARDDPVLAPYFYKTVACDRLPKTPLKTLPQAYIVNTDPHGRPGEHWLAPVPVHYCYGAWQDRFQTMKDRGVHFHEGIPDHSALGQWFPHRRGGILVLDDLIDEGSNDKRVLDLFSKHSHHQNVTVLYLCQDMFPVGKYAKSISRNAHYIVAFKNPRDQLGVCNVLLQSFPTTWKDSLETFHRATMRPYGYLVLDLHPASPDPQRLLSNLLKDEG